MLVDFWAPWCQPCKLLAAVLEKFAAARPDITVAKVDIEAEPGLASQYQIFGVPTLVLFVKGREVHRVSGAIERGAIGSGIPALARKEVNSSDHCPSSMCLGGF